MTEDYIMYCIFSKEAIKAMGGNRGKLASMAGHAYLHAWWDSERKYSSYYGSLGGDSPGNADLYKDSEFAKKVTLAVETTEQLEARYKRIKDMPYGKTLVVDRGLTVFEKPTTVCIGFGPVPRREVPYAISTLKVLI